MILNRRNISILLRIEEIMGLLDNAKSKLSGSFGDETVRIVDYDAERLEKEKKEKAAKIKKTPPKRPEKPKKPIREKNDTSEEDIEFQENQGGHTKKRRNINNKDSENIYDLDELLDENSDNNSESSVINYDTNDQNIDDNSKNNSSFFDLDDDDDFLKKQQEAYNKEMAMYSNVPSLQVMENRIQDILEVMDIPATFAIESDIFLPDDVKDIVFDLQAPFGYDQGQVELYLQKTKNTVARYFELLTMRNEHVAKLATVIDKQQVDANNLRYQNEINNGINIMPSSDTDDIESQLVEAKLMIRQLEDQIKYNKIGHGQDENEPNKIEELYNQISILNREKEQLQEENYYLKNQVAALEYEIDSDNEKIDHTKENKSILPNFNDDIINTGASTPNKPINSAFDFEDDEEENIDHNKNTGSHILNSKITDNDKHITIDNDDEDEDMLDIIMKDWNPEE